MRIFKTAALAACLLAFFGAAPGAAQEGFPEAGRVVRVFDGDTVLVEADSRKFKVRLLGIDAPEKDGPYTKAEPMGNEAGAAAAAMALGAEVRLVYAAGKKKDRYGRLLAYVILPGGKNMGAALLSMGLAEVYRKGTHPLKKEYMELERRARAARLGIWRTGPRTGGRGR